MQVRRRRISGTAHMNPEGAGVDDVEYDAAAKNIKRSDLCRASQKWPQLKPSGKRQVLWKHLAARIDRDFIQLRVVLAAVKPPGVSHQGHQLRG